MVRVNQFSMTTDLQISERVSGEGVVVDESVETKLKQGNSGHKISKLSEQTKFKKYQTRIVSVAKKVNLKFEDVVEELKKNLASSIAGIF